MACTGARVADVCSWDPDMSTIFELPFSDELWTLMQAWMQKWADSSCAPGPCDETQAVLDLALKLAQDATKNQRLVYSLRAARDA